MKESIESVMSLFAMLCFKRTRSMLNPWFCRLKLTVMLEVCKNERETACERLLVAVDFKQVNDLIDTTYTTEYLRRKLFRIFHDERSAIVPPMANYTQLDESMNGWVRATVGVSRKSFSMQPVYSTRWLTKINRLFALFKYHVGFLMDAIRNVGYVCVFGGVAPTEI